MTSARSLMAFRHATDLRLMITEYLDDASAVALKNANNYLRSDVTVENPKHMEPECEKTASLNNKELKLHSLDSTKNVESPAPGSGQWPCCAFRRYYGFLSALFTE
ncbi:hypothetical protein IFM47457_11033 [Aspergillus lentulus]|nr:hypothetical protein IFM47457_11033 [Aspergillus lentulus]